METTRRTLSVNGSARTADVEDRKLLLDTLREDLGLTGAHAGCEHGVCGACTVLLDGVPVRSCLMFTAQAEGHEIETVEGLADGDDLHPLQQSFLEHLGFQCGYCTPGMLLTAKEFLRRNAEPTHDEAREAIAGNLCRCTGYGSIVESVVQAAAAMRSGGGDGSGGTGR